MGKLELNKIHIDLTKMVTSGDDKTSSVENVE
jgi:hypothetical protein